MSDIRFCLGMAKIRAREVGQFDRWRAGKAELVTLEALANLVPELVKALGRLEDQCKRTFEVTGGCDHSVGICECADRDDYEDAKETLTKARRLTGGESDGD